MCIEFFYVLFYLSWFSPHLHHRNKIVNKRYIRNPKRQIVKAVASSSSSNRQVDRQVDRQEIVLDSEETSMKKGRRDQNLNNYRKYKEHLIKQYLGFSDISSLIDMEIIDQAKFALIIYFRKTVPAFSLLPLF